MTTTPDISELAKALQALVQEQKGIDTEDKDTLTAAKEASKQALFVVLKAVSAAPKDELTEGLRQQLDDTLLLADNNAATLKWPLLRSLEDIRHYRAFLGLPKLMEQTRQFLTTSSVAKLEEILGTNLSVSMANATDTQDLQWVDPVLQCMTGDGRRKKDLNGFVLQGGQKGVVRAAMNKVKKRLNEVLAGEKQQQQQQQSNQTDQKSTSTASFIDRDVRIVDKERQETRAQDFGSLVDAALQQKKK